MMKTLWCIAVFAAHKTCCSSTFPADFSVQDEGNWLSAPFAIPVRTGITLLEGTAESTGAVMRMN